MGTDAYAHSLSGKPVEEWQGLESHLCAVAKIASGHAARFDSADWAWNASWLHDLGKAAREFQAYLRRQNGIKDVDYDDVGHNRVNHSSAGAAYALEAFDPLFGRLLAYLVAGHHAGLPDWHPSATGGAALKARLEEGGENLASIRQHLHCIFRHLRRPIKPPPFVKLENCHVWMRMLFSCLVDADFLDTEFFVNRPKASGRGGYPILPALKKRFDAHMQELLQHAEPTAVNIARREILLACREAASQKPGLFTLAVPTGGGKTLSAMAFALDHAVMHDQRRIVYVIPYTSIIEQTAEILSEIFGADNVVEHHSNLDPDRETQRSRLASENWDAPVIVTTNVQLFESLHAARPSRCRKLHNLVDSVIILDEAQLLPPELLKPCVDVVKDLVRHYGVSIVLSTATQPKLPNLGKAISIIDDPETYYGRLKRTSITMPADLNLPLGWEDLAGKLQKHDRVLCIVNTRRDCYQLHRLMPSDTVHLSALMCGAHRSEVIDRIRKELSLHKDLRVVSTQLVEAGVDIDFPVVYRALSGLDSISQAAGRCNREGRLNDQGRLGEVHVFVPPKPSPRGLLLKGENTTRELLALAGFDPEHPDAFQMYFERFYSRVNDTGSEFGELLVRDAHLLEFQFRTAADRFRLIDDSQHPVFVQYGESHRWLKNLRQSGPERRVLRKLQRYTVNLSRKDFAKATMAGMVDQVGPGFWRWIGKYDRNRGLDLYHSGWEPEDLMV